MATVYGIFQSDVIIRTAIKAALDDLRANPWLLDYAFISLPQDPLTFRDYGEGEIDKAKKWFLSTDIPVLITPRIDEAKMPCISIALQESNETSEATLGDVNYETDMDLPDVTNLAGPFTASGYNSSLGKVSVKEADLKGLILAPNMLLVDDRGHLYPIVEVLNSLNGIASFSIAPNTTPSLTSATIRGNSPMFKLPLESCIMKETYSVGCHVNTDFTHLIYLHCVLTFSLLRYKQRLFEARGFEQSTISSSAPMVDDSYGNELVYERFVSVTGMVRQYWPKDLTPTIQSFSMPIKITGSMNVPNDTDPKNATWVGDLDSIG